MYIIMLSESVSLLIQSVILLLQSVILVEIMPNNFPMGGNCPWGYLS